MFWLYYYFFASFAARDKTYLTLSKLWKDSTGKSSRPNRNSFNSHKLVLLGGQSVGKTSLTLRFVDGKFTSGQTSTIVAAFLSKTLQLEDETIKLEIWDTAGQERFNSLVPNANLQVAHGNVLKKVFISHRRDSLTIENKIQFTQGPSFSFVC